MRGGAGDDEAISLRQEIASGEEQERPRNDVSFLWRGGTCIHMQILLAFFGGQRACDAGLCQRDHIFNLQIENGNARPAAYSELFSVQTEGNTATAAAIKGQG